MVTFEALNLLLAAALALEGSADNGASPGVASEAAPEKLTVRIPESQKPFKLASSQTVRSSSSAKGEVAVPILPTAVWGMAQEKMDLRGWKECKGSWYRTEIRGEMESRQYLVFERGALVGVQIWESGEVLKAVFESTSAKEAIRNRYIRPMTKRLGVKPKEDGDRTQMFLHVDAEWKRDADETKLATEATYAGHGLKPNPGAATQMASVLWTSVVGGRKDIADLVDTAGSSCF